MLSTTRNDSVSRKRKKLHCSLNAFTKKLLYSYYVYSSIIPVKKKTSPMQFLVDEEENGSE